MTAQQEISRFLSTQFISVATNTGIASVSVLAVVTFLQGVGVLTLNQELTRIVSLLAAIYLGSAPIWKRKLLSTKIANPVCNHCSSRRMVSTGLVCLDCGSTVGPPKSYKDILEKKE